VIVDSRGGQRNVRDHLSDTLEELAPIALDLGCDREFASISRILDDGASYARQLSVADAAGGDLSEVVQHLIREFRSGPEASTHEG
jgi:carboxylate-amine ligase